MSESNDFPLLKSEFPRSTNRLLTPSEKEFVDRFPDDLAAAVLEFDDADIKAVVMTNSGVEARNFYGERAVAVRDYLDMQIAYGLRKNPRE